MGLNEDCLPNICRQFPPRIGCALILCLAKDRGVSEKMLRKLAPYIITLSPEQRVAILIASPKVEKAGAFVFLPRLDPESRGMITHGIMGELVQRGLHLKTEAYLRVPDEDYCARTANLKDLVSTCFMSQQEKTSLMKTLAFYERKEQRLLLQYLKKTERESLFKMYTAPH